MGVPQRRVAQRNSSAVEVVVWCGWCSGVVGGVEVGGEYYRHYFFCGRGDGGVGRWLHRKVPPSPSLIYMRARPPRACVCMYECILSIHLYSN